MAAQALGVKGKDSALLRHAAAGLLSTLSSLNYPFAAAEVIALYGIGDKGAFVSNNEPACPPGGK